MSVPIITFRDQREAAVAEVRRLHGLLDSFWLGLHEMVRHARDEDDLILAFGRFDNRLFAAMKHDGVDMVLDQNSSAAGTTPALSEVSPPRLEAEAGRCEGSM